MLLINAIKKQISPFRCCERLILIGRAQVTCIGCYSRNKNGALFPLLAVQILSFGTKNCTNLILNSILN